MQIGHGYDIHKLVEGRKLIIGGVEIPHEKGLLGHSDADVLIHAIIDAILGASCLGDIGKYFPDTDSKWKDANSMDLLKVTLESIKNLGRKINNIDSTIIAEAPKLSPYIDKMRENIAKALEININQVNVKAKTNEEQDSMGNKSSICAHAVVILT
jgi:2-C-methyl-D-erythritol 2,4-cyclodiphosphate synthase